MQYFNSLPRILKTDDKGNSLLLTNLMARISIIPSLLKNPAVFYKYDIQDGDTPESIAHKYYGDVYRYWIVLFANQILDPQWEWPLSSKAFEQYILDKYPTTNVYATPYEYRKIVTTIDNVSTTQTEHKSSISFDEYNILEEETNTYNLPSGGSVTVIVSKKTVSIYEHEVEENEKNRNINILKTNYIPQLERDFVKLLEK